MNATVFPSVSSGNDAPSTSRGLIEPKEPLIRSAAANRIPEAQPLLYKNRFLVLRKRRLFDTFEEYTRKNPLIRDKRSYTW